MGSDDAKKRQKKSVKNAGNGKVDDRFVSAQSDPRFMEAPRRKAKVAIDSRFQRVFTDSRFVSSGAPVDKRGKPADKTSKKASASLKHYYRLEEEERDSDTGTDDVAGGNDDIGEQSSEDSSSTDSTDSDDESVEDEEEDTFMPPEEDVPEIEKETHRLAVVNMDWSQVRAVDLYVLLSSFLPKGGQIMSVTVYPSEFGLRCMQEEATRGPVGLFDDEEELDNEDDGEIDNKKLRAYELSRLRYYYAVVECDSIATADYLYKTCDAVEFERSANKLDLRFIPDSMNFKHQPRDVATEAPTGYEGVDFQTRALQQSNVHLTWDEDEPQRKKTLNRKLNAEQLAELELKQFLASDESETDDDDDDDNVTGTLDRSMKKREKQDMYRALIQSGDGSDDHHDEVDNHEMEVTFNSGLEDISKHILEKKDKKSETVWDAYLRKRREKKKALKNRPKYSSDDNDSDTDQELTEQHDDFFVEGPSSVKNKGIHVSGTKRGNLVEETAQETGASRAELELLLADDKGADTNLKGYNMKPKKEGKKQREIPDGGKIPTFDSDDPRFAALFTSPLFAVDPTNPQFKRSATYTRQIAQKRKMIDQENDATTNVSNSGQDSEIHMHKHKHMKADVLPPRKEKSELASLVKSIKMKSKQLPLPSRDKVPPKYRLGHKAKKQI